MAKIVFIGAIKTLGTAGKPPDEVRKYVNPDNIVYATIQETEEGWVWSFKMLDGTSLNSMAFNDYNTSMNWAYEHNIAQTGK